MVCKTIIGGSIPPRASKISSSSIWPIQLQHQGGTSVARTFSSVPEANQSYVENSFSGPAHTVRARLQILEMSEAEWRSEIFPQVQPVLFRNGHEYIDDRGVKLAPGTALDFFPGVGHR